MLFEKAKELYLLQRKRELEYFILKFKNDIIQQEINFSKLNTRKEMENNKQQNEIVNYRNSLQPYPINYEVTGYQNLYENYSYKLNPEENNKFQIMTNDMKTNLLKNSSVNTKYNYFNENKIIDKNYLLNSNNEIKVLKNNKVVFINSYFLNSYSTSRAIKKLSKINFLKRKKRSSKYRGVSKNGNKFQVLMMINKKRCYKGSFSSEVLAARIYDIHAIKTRGIKARTNFVYNNIQIKKIYEQKINLDNIDNISDIMAQLI